MNNEFAWFKLLFIKGLGAKSLLVLYNGIKKHSLEVADIYKLKQDRFYSIFNEFGKGRFSRVKYENFFDIDDEGIFDAYERLSNEGVQIIPLNDKNYPESIKKILKSESPPVLFCKGYLPLLSAKNVSIVGSRSTDDFTLLLTKSIAGNLSSVGYNVVSGYAKGVDTNAHLGALESSGTTSIVLSQGINHLSIKKDFRNLNWEHNSLFISQFLPFEKWSARNAMTRNKTVIGLSKAIIVMTSGPERDSKGRMSGTFDAGKSALKLGVPVFVLSPSLLKNAEGNEELIKMGGIEFKNGKDIINILESESSLLNTPFQTKMFG